MKTLRTDRQTNKLTTIGPPPTLYGGDLIPSFGYKTVIEWYHFSTYLTYPFKYTKAHDVESTKVQRLDVNSVLILC